MSFTRPAHLWVPPGARGTYVDEVADLATMMRRPLDASQRVAVEARTSYGAGGRWLTLESCTKMGRQSGKTGGIETPIVFADLFLWNADRIAWTAHLFKTTREAFQDHKQLIASTPELDRRVAKIQEANGEEAIILKGGARLDYLARSKGGGRGLGGKRVVVDEALFFTDEQAGALLPILAARSADAPQIDYLSSACKVESRYLRRLTRRGRVGNDPSLILVEFCAPGGWDDPGCERGTDCHHTLGTRGCALDDPVRLMAANPAVASGRVSLDFLEAMRRSLSPLEFGREFLGWDEPGDEDEAGDKLSVELWDSRADARSQVPDGAAVVLSLDVSPDRRTAAIGLAGKREDGRTHLGLIRHRPGKGTDWAVGELLELAENLDAVALVVDGASPAAAFVPRLETAGFSRDEDAYPRLVVTTAGGMAGACQSLVDALEDDRARHAGDPIVHDAVVDTTSRDVGDGGFAWARKRSEGDITPTVVLTLAHHGLEVAGEPSYDLADSIF